MWLGMQYALANKLIYSKVKPALGLGNLRVAVSGAAPISREVIEFFTGLDVNILEVYGQSEGSGPTTFNLPGRTRLGTVGPAIPGCEVRLAEDGEIQARGPNIFLGYFKDPVATDETLKDGWLLSGDLGAFDADGFLSIVGRKKEIIITAGGKNVAPKNIEVTLKDNALIADAVVIGDRRAYLTALLVLDDDAVARFCATNRCTPTDAPLRAELQRAVDACNAVFARVEHIRKFQVLPRPFTVATGELTPSLKVKRKVVYKNFEKEIEGMYASGEA